MSNTQECRGQNGLVITLAAAGLLLTCYANKVSREREDCAVHELAATENIYFEAEPPALRVLQGDDYVVVHPQDIRKDSTTYLLPEKKRCAHQVITRRLVGGPAAYMTPQPLYSLRDIVTRGDTQTVITTRFLRSAGDERSFGLTVYTPVKRE